MTAEPRRAERAYDFLIFIDRFQPFHLGHKAAIDRALELAERVIVLVGSASRPRSLRNPFTWPERSAMILGAYPADQGARISVRPVADAPYSDTAWARAVRETVREVVGGHRTDHDPRIGLIGYDKDAAGDYFARFPDWEGEIADPVARNGFTGIREPYLRALAEASLEVFAREEANRLPESTLAFLRAFAADEANAGFLVEEWRVIEGYRAGWAGTPFAPVFVTVDAVVVQAGHVLLIRRKFAPGRGRLALPGGYVEPHECLEDAVVRELAEETRVALPASELKRLIGARRVYDDPYRSDRGRAITHAFLIEIPDRDAGLTAIEAGDDAEQAFWTPVDDLDPESMFEDHWDIVQDLVSGRRSNESGSLAR